MLILVFVIFGRYGRVRGTSEEEEEEGGGEGDGC